MDDGAAWPRRSHGELVALAENLWMVEGPVPGALYRRQMTVVRDSQRRLLLHSAIAMDDARMAQLEQLGTPSWLVVPNGYHRLDAPAYKQRYPEICVVAPRGALARVQRVVRVDLTYDEFPNQPALKLEAAAWPDAAEGVVKVRSADGTSLVFNDLLWTPADRGFAGWILRVLRQEPQVPWLARRMFARDSTVLRAWLEGLARTPELVRLIPGHGPAVVGDAAATLQRVAARV